MVALTTRISSDNKSKTSLLLKEMQKKLAIRTKAMRTSSDDDDDDDTSDGKYDGESDSDIEQRNRAFDKHFGWRLQSTSSITVLPNRKKMPKNFSFKKLKSL